MKKLTIFMALIFISLTQIAWSPVNPSWSNTDLNDGHGTRHEIFLNSDSILGGATYSLFIDPTHVDFVHWYSNNANPIPSTLKWVCSTTTEVDMIELGRQFGPPRSQPVGYFEITVPSNCDIAAGTHYGLITLFSHSTTGFGVESNILSFSTTFGDLSTHLFTPYLDFNISEAAATAYASGFSKGVTSTTGSSVNALTSFIPQLLGVGFGFFLQIASVEVLGISLLSIVALMVTLAGTLVTIKVMTGGR